MASFCPSCGNALAQDARFCTGCGAQIAVPVAASAAPAAPAAPSPPIGSAQQAPPPPWAGQPAPQAAPWAAQPSPQAPWAAAPARKSSHWMRNVAIVVVLLIVGVIGLAFLATSGPVEAVDRHLSLLAQGDLQTAYAETSDGFKGQVTFAQFTQLVATYPILKQNTASWTSRSINGNEAVIEGTLTAPDQSKAKAEYNLTNGGDGTWRILGIGVTPLK